MKNWKLPSKLPGKPRPHYVNSLLEQSVNTNISAVVGVRRSGKSTILKQVLFSLAKNKHVNPKNILFVNFEDPRLINLLDNGQLFTFIDKFRAKADKSQRAYVVLDEIQNLPGWESILRTLHDQESNLKFYVTGSSAQLLNRELGAKLSGRYLKTEVFPLSFGEFIKFTKFDTNKYIEMGGFPDPVLTRNQDTREQLLRDYYESILIRDIAIRYKVKDELKLRRLTAQLFSNISNQASSYRLSRDLGMSSDTILQYFSYIEDAYLGFFVPKLSQSVRKQNYNPKKFYAIDNGLQSAVSFRVIDDLGKLFENTVFLTLRRIHREIFYFQEDKEVDFIVKEKERIRYIINASVNIDDKNTRQRETESLMEAMFHLSQKESFLIILDGKSEIIETEVGVIRVIKYGKFVSHCKKK